MCYEALNPPLLGVDWLNVNVADFLIEYFCRLYLKFWMLLFW
jgi:hypothetical protein